MAIGIGISPFLKRAVIGSPSTLLNGLSASWSLNGSPNDNLGLNNGIATNITYTSGKFNQCGVFTGTSYISVADSSIFTFGNYDFAYSIWVKRNLSGTREIFTGQSDSGGSDSSISFWIEFNVSNKIRVLMTAAGSPIQFISTNGISDTNWHNIIIQRNGINCEIYIDGVLDSSHSGLSTGAINDSSFQFGIGNAGDLSVLLFNGNVDEVNLWTGRKLTNTEIIQLQTKAYPF